MGVLEDAIREHLELKRRHGASEEEVERNELEALGPARREFEGAAEETPADEVAVAEPAEPVPEEHEPATQHEAEPELELELELEREPELDLEPEPDAAERPPLEPPPEPGIAEPATTRLHDSPPAEADFDEDEDEDEADKRSPRDWDFD